MSTRKKISEIADEMFEIINQKPTIQEIDELAEILNENIDAEDIVIDKVAVSHRNEGIIDGHEASRV
ncbi:MAG: hypothetical protein N4A33_00970 [Bacteriovoracaceae bacterium]|jgi:hypothetical protein|nr:hypothetical protein [Bacteriovoracaceae bacterium]